MTHTIPEDDFTGSLEGLGFAFFPPDGVPISDSNRPFEMNAVMDDQSGEDAPWRYDTQYTADLLAAGLDAMVAKIATDYPLADPATYYLRAYKSKGF